MPQTAKKPQQAPNMTQNTIANPTSDVTSTSNSDNSDLIGLACAGGIVEGAIYEIGALCALEESITGLNLNNLEVYVGISSGSLLTACLANGISAQTLSHALIGQADEEALNLKPHILFSFALREYIERIGNIPRAIWKSFEYFLKHPTEWSLWGSMGGFGAVIPTGIFENSALERYVSTMFAKDGRTNDFRELDAKLRIVATHLDTAGVACFGENGLSDVPISKAIQASTALPGLYTPVEINNTHYIDGVARRTVHATAALKEGVTLLFCVNPIVPVNNELQHEQSRNLNDYGLPVVMSQTLRVMVASRMQTGFERYKTMYPHADTILIEPKLDDFEFFFSNIFSFSNRHHVCEHAYQTTRQFLRENASEIEAKLQKHHLSLNWEALDSTRKLFDEDQIKPKGTLYEMAENTFSKLDDLIGSIRASVGV